MTSALFFLGAKRRGRKPRGDVASTERVWMKITPAEREALNVVAKENGVHVATVIRDAVNSYVADYCDRTVFVPRIRE